MHHDYLSGDDAAHHCGGQHDAILPGDAGWGGPSGVVVNKLLDRGSLSATTIVGNVQDFITLVARGLGVMDQPKVK